MGKLADRAKEYLERIQKGGSMSPIPDLQTWRELAALSVGITQDSPRYRPMFDALTACDDAYQTGNWPAFWRAAEQAKAIVSPSARGAA